MCRFAGIEDPEYRKVAAAIERILQNLPTKLQTGLVSQNGSGASNYPSTRTVDIVSQQRCTADTKKMANLDSVCQISDTVQDEARRYLIDLLGFDQIDARLWTLKTAQSKTCQWFLHKVEYTDWMSPEKLQQHNGFLWVKGKAGAGKSILMKFLFSEAKKLAKSDPDIIVVSFFFNARGNDLEMTTVGLYRSLLLQVFQVVPDLRVVLDGLDCNAQRLIRDHGWRIEILKKILADAVEALGKRTLIFFIDALDECNNDQVTDMISFFEDLGERAVDAQTHLHICFSSRHYPTIVIRRGIEVILEDEKEHEVDITRYIKSNLKIGNSIQAGALSLDILKKAQGIFLWVALVIPILNKEYGKGLVGTLRNRLKDIPSSLEKLFEMIITRDYEDVQGLRVCTQWILFAMRPLKPQELYFAVQIGIDQTTPTSWDMDNISLDVLHRFVQTFSKGLAEVTKSIDPTVQFIHESVRDFFLLGQRGRKLWPNFNEYFVGHSHNILKSCCLAQINAVQTIEDPPEIIRTTYPFLEYAATNVLTHSNKAQSIGVAQSDFITTFPLKQWIKLSNLFEKYKARHYTNKASLLYILTEHNCASLIKVYPDATRHFDIYGERYSYPFIAAVVLRNEDAIRELVRAALPNQPEALMQLHSCIDGFTPGRGYRCLPSNGLLYFLLKFSHEGMIRHFLEIYPTAINSKDLNGLTALSQAAWTGNEAVIKILIEAGANLKSKDNAGFTALSRAAWQGNEATVKILIENGASAIYFKSS